MHEVYILKSIGFSKTYVGSAKNAIRRLEEHNRGKSRFTSRFKPWKIIYCEQADSYSAARKREKYFKSGAGRRFIKTLLND